MTARRGRLPLLVVATLSLPIAACDTWPWQESVDSGARFGATAAGDPASAETLARLGDHTMAQGDITSAIALYRRAHAAAPAEVDPLIKLGSALQQLGSYREAAGAYRTALQNQPGNAQAARGVANAYLAMKQPTQALPFLEQALASNDTPAVRNSLGVALDMTGRHAEAQSHYRMALAEAPDDLDIATNLGISLALAGSSSEAIATMEQVAAAPAAQARHRQNLALVYGLAGREAEAAETMRSDLPEAAIPATLDAIAQLRAIPDSAARALAIGGGAGIGPI